MTFRETFFLTGFPGFIAGRLVARMAAPETRFYLLVQPQFLAKAKSDAERISRETGVSAENFVVIEGDITKDGLGLDETVAAEVIATTTDVFHLAAIYDLAIAREPAFRVNVDGTRNVNDFVRKLPQLRRYNYISTCYVAGRRTGTILETDLKHDAGFRNYYEETKYLAEVAVAEMMTDLPVTIFRPSVVVGDSKTGETAKYDGIYAVILYVRMFPSLLRLINVGNNEVRLNLVPVDFVVEGIAALARDPRAVGRTIALADPEPFTTAEIFDAFAGALSGKPSALTPPASVVQFILNLPFSPVITGLPHDGVPYFFLHQLYDTAISRELLRNHGISCPRLNEYAANLVDFVQRNPNPA